MGWLRLERKDDQPMRSNLRHPIHAIREPFGTAGLIVAVIALVLALGGGALAASGALSGKQRQEVIKIAKRYAGSPGAPGKDGAAGKNGSDGAPGKNGSDGLPGQAATVTLGAATGCGAAGGTKLTTGSESQEVCNGASGEPGKSVVATPSAGGAGEPCEGVGGVVYEVEGSADAENVCNGRTGDPWAAGGTLPADGMETGTWTASGEGQVTVPLSFPIHLSQRIEPDAIFFGVGAGTEEVEPEPGVIEISEFEAHCEASAGNPRVASEFQLTLCIYLSSSLPVEASFVKVFRTGGNEGVGPAGGFLTVEFASEGSAFGSYAVSGG